MAKTRASIPTLANVLKNIIKSTSKTENFGFRSRFQKIKQKEDSVTVLEKK